MSRIVLPISLLLLMSACARSEDASVVADSNDTMPAIERRTAPDADNEEIATGEWRDALQEQAAAIEFGAAGSPPVFSMRCDGRGGIVLQRHGNAPTGDLPTMAVTIGRDARRLAVTAAEGNVPMLRAAIAGGDPLIAAIARAVEPIVIRIGNTEPLVLPPGPAIGAFTTRCGGTSAPAAAGNASDTAAATNAATDGNSTR
jgi:hypothetical protein